MGIELGGIILSKSFTDKKHGTWWAIGTKKEWFEFRVTNDGKIKLLSLYKGKHPYFTIKD